MKGPKDWWKRFFDPAFYTPASPVARARAASEARFVRKALGLRRGDAVLDLCCGPGRHSLLLARMGLRVTGLDFSVPYLLEARSDARKLGLSARFVHGDMRRVPFRGEFDAVVCLFTSFGYFDRLGDELKVLRGVARALKPDGRFLIDVIDRAWLVRNGTPKDWHFLEDGGFLLEERTQERAWRRARNRWIRVFPDGKSMERVFALRQYDVRELSALVRRAGLRPVKVWGRYDGSRPGPGTDRIILLSRKPGARPGR